MEIILTFKQVDFWNRPVFQMDGSNILIGSTEKLFDYGEDPRNIIDYFESNVSDLVIFGTVMDDDPLGTRLKSSLSIKFNRA